MYDFLGSGDKRELSAMFDQICMAKVMLDNGIPIPPHWSFYSEGYSEDRLDFLTQCIDYLFQTSCSEVTHGSHSDTMEPIYEFTFDVRGMETLTYETMSMPLLNIFSELAGGITCPLTLMEIVFKRTKEGFRVIVSDSQDGIYYPTIELLLKFKTIFNEFLLVEEKGVSA